jgi:hypothetical protein
MNVSRWEPPNVPAAIFRLRGFSGLTFVKHHRRRDTGRVMTAAAHAPGADKAKAVAQWLEPW